MKQIILSKGNNTEITPVLISDGAALGARVVKLMAELQERNDPRYKEVLKVLETARESHPSYQHSDPDVSNQAYFAGHREVVSYVERKYPDLYEIIQNALPHLVTIKPRQKPVECTITPLFYDNKSKPKDIK